ncbi:MAG: VIT domain-containing protein [Candidatus Sumerlaeota bacterium]
MKIEIKIDDQVARTHIDQSFRNPNSRRVEGTYLFPLPANAAVKDLSLHIDGKPMKAEVLDADKAREIYEGIVRRQRDPALLEYVGRDLVKLRIFPIEPGQTRRVEFAYSQVLERDFALTEYNYPLASRHMADHPIAQLTITGRIQSKLPVTTTYCPTHEMDLVEEGEKAVQFSYEAEQYSPERDLRLYYASGKDAVQATLLTHRPDQDEPGTFMLMIAPRREAAQKNRIPKDVTFVLDTSGSMMGDKIVQAREALKFCLKALNADDRFRVIRFSTATESFEDTFLKADDRNVGKALEFVEGFEAAGGTAIDEALKTALRIERSEGRPHLVVFLTDGKPTIGEVDKEKIIENTSKHRPENVRLFTFGVGYNVNTHLLDSLADDNGGASQYVDPEEDLEVKVSSFFRKVSDPVLTDLSLDFGDIRALDTYPRTPPDLFAGSELMLIGRYRNGGDTTLLLKGREGKEEKAYEYEMTFPEVSEDADFLPRLWAIRRVGHLMDEIRKHGENAELREEVERLGKKYAIATPYTSLLVVEDDEPMMARPVERMDEANAQADAGFDLSVRRKVGAPAAPQRAAESFQMESGAGAVARSRVLKDYKSVASVDQRKEKSALHVKTVLNRTFYQSPDGTWIETGFEKAPKDVDVTLQYGSEEYFDFVAKNPKLTKLLSLGTEIIFRNDGKWYRVTE